MRQRPGRCDFESLVRTESTRVFAAAHRILRDRGKAEDVMQEVFLGVVQGRIGLDEAADPGAVLAWWAAKSALSTLRSENRRLVREEAGAMAHAGPSAAVSDQDALALWAEVAELPDPLAQAVWAKFQDGKTLSALARAAGVSVTTAHSRVNKGLEELRTRLASAGGVALLPRLEAILASAPAATPSAAAVSSLLALGAAAPAAAMSPVGALCAMLLLGTVVGAAVWIESPPTPPVSSAPRGVARAAPDLRSSPPSSVDPVEARVFEPILPSATERGTTPAAPIVTSGRITGRVVDENRIPLEHVKVAAESEVRDGKMSRYGSRALTGSDGIFEILVPVETDTERYRLRFDHAEFKSHTRGDLEVKAKQDHHLQDIELVRIVDDRPGKVSLRVLVLDPDGKPVPKAGVGLVRRLRDGTTRHEVGGSADAQGEVMLETKTCGSKRLVLNVQWLGFRNLEQSLEVDETSPSRIEIRLDRGKRIAGRLSTPEGGVPKNVPLHVRDERTQTWWFGTIQDDGRFEISGLEDGPYTLYLGGQLWSQYRAERIRAGTAELDLIVKPLTTETPVGHHLAELHGVLTHEATGEAVRADLFEVTACRVPTEDRAEILSRHIFEHLRPFLGQRSLSGDHPDDGGFHLDGLEAGIYIVAVRQRGFAPTWAGPFRLGPNEVRGSIRIPLALPVEVRGRVVDSSGNPVAGAWIVPGQAASGEDWRAGVSEHLRKTGGRGQPLFSLFAQTGETGEFTLSGLPIGVPLEVAAFHPRAESGAALRLTLESGAGPSDLALTLGSWR